MDRAGSSYSGPEYAAILTLKDRLIDILNKNIKIVRIIVYLKR